MRPADGSPTPRARMDDLTVERVLRTVEAIPPGRVANYGQVGEVAGVGARLVGRIMSTWGSSVPWWRVVGADGRMAPPLRARAREHWEAEGIPLAPHGEGCAIRRVRADPATLRAAAQEAWVDLPKA